VLEGETYVRNNLILCLNGDGGGGGEGGVMRLNWSAGGDVWPKGNVARILAQRTTGTLAQVQNAGSANTASQLLFLLTKAPFTKTSLRYWE
jgi:hypothetical protein